MYDPALKTSEQQIATAFTYHPPKDDQPRRYESIRADASIARNE